MQFFNYIFILAFIFAALCVNAQSSKVEQARVNFIAQKIQLTESESKIFWPLYNEYIDKMKAIRRERKKLFKEYNYSNNPSEAEQFIYKNNQFNVSEAQIKNEYIQKFKAIIGVVKTAYLIKAEEEFRLELVKILKNDKQE